MSETYQKAVFFMFKGYMIKTQKRSNTEPHGIPEALDGFVGKVVEFSTIWKCRECLELTKNCMFFTFKCFMRKPQKRPNTEPQGIPEADDRFFGKLVHFYTISMKKH